MKTAFVFDIVGKYGLFKKPYSPLSPVSFPIPPPTAIYGMIGAIAGFSKYPMNDNYYLRLINEGDIQVGIKLLAPIKRYRAGLNLLITKGTQYFRPKGSHIPERENAKPRQEASRTQIPTEFLVDPEFRIFFAHSNPRVTDAIERQLTIAKSTVYTPCFGIAQCLAEIKYSEKYPGIFPIQEIRDGKNQLDCVVPLSRAKVHYEQGEKLFRFRVPALMAPDRTVTYYEDVIINEEAKPIRVEVKSYEKIGGDSLLLIQPKPKA